MDDIFNVEVYSYAGIVFDSKKEMDMYKKEALVAEVARKKGLSLVDNKDFAARDIALLAKERWCLKTFGFWDDEMKLKYDTKTGAVNFLPENLKSLCLVLSHKYRIAKNVLTGLIYVDDEELSDSGANLILRDMQVLTNTDHIKHTMLMKAIDICAGEKSFNPIKDMLLGLRVVKNYDFDKTLIDYMGAEDIEINRIICHKWMYAAVRRAFIPGSKVEGALVLSGKQGCGKSTFFDILSMRKAFYSDDTIDFASDWKGAARLKGRWIVEFAELANLKKSELEDVKKFLTKTEDTYAPKGSNFEQKWFRSVVFGGTTNETQYLVDKTGERRFWTVPVKGLDRSLSREIENIWANVVKYFLDNPNEVPEFCDDREKILLEEAQSDALTGDAMEEAVLDYMDKYQKPEYTLLDFIGHKCLDRFWLERNLKRVMNKNGFTFKRIKNKRIYVSK